MGVWGRKPPPRAAQAAWQLAGSWEVPRSPPVAAGKRLEAEVGPLRLCLEVLSRSLFAGAVGPRLPGSQAARPPATWRLTSFSPGHLHLGEWEPFPPEPGLVAQRPGCVFIG